MTSRLNLIIKYYVHICHYDRIIPSIDQNKEIESKKKIPPMMIMLIPFHPFHICYCFIQGLIRMIEPISRVIERTNTFSIDQMLKHFDFTSGVG